MALSEIDRSLLERCLAKKPRAWEDFVDRYMGLVMHVVNHTAQSRSILLSQSKRQPSIMGSFTAPIPPENTMGGVARDRGEGLGKMDRRRRPRR